MFTLDLMEFIVRMIVSSCGEIKVAANKLQVFTLPVP